MIATLFCLLAFPSRSPAPLVYRPEEGWTYEKPGADTKWQRQRASEQLEVAQQAFKAKDYSLAVDAAKRVTTRWAFSDYAPQAQYLLGRCYEAQGKDETAFKHYQTILEKYPKMTNANEVIERQFIIANMFLGGHWRKLWGVIPIPCSTEKVIEFYEKLIKNAPYSDVAPQAQMNIGLAHEKNDDFAQAVKAYEKAADKYSERESVAATALYKAGLANLKESKTAEYDQNSAGQAINTFTDFSALYPNDARSGEARKKIDELKTEQSRGSFQIAKFYEKKKKWAAAMIYYGECIAKDPNSSYATEARKRLVEIKQKVEGPQPVRDATQPKATETAPAKTPETK